MILFLNHLYTTRRRILIGLPFLVASILLCYQEACSDLSTTIEVTAFGRLLGKTQNGWFAGFVYTPIFVSLVSQLLNYVRSPQLILRIGGVSRSFKRALSISLLVTILYSTLLFALTLVILLLPHVKAPKTEGFMLVASLFAEYFAYVLYFFSCSILMLIVYALSGRKANISITFILGYGLFDYLSGVLGIVGISATRYVSALPIGWTCIHDITAGLFVHSMAVGLPRAVESITYLLCFCVFGCLVLYLISNNFDCLSERKVDCRA